MLARVSEARRIQPSRAIPGVVLSRAGLIARIKDHVAKEIPVEAIRHEGMVLQLLGFIPTSFDYEAAEYALLEAQLAGYYEPADGTMYLAEDLGEEEASATLAHELVHALQDSRWDLKARSKYRPGQGDQSSAVSALAEGDATSLMFDVMLARAGTSKTALDLPDDVFADQILESMQHGPGADAPAIMRASLAAPYIYGTQFVHALRRRGGWDAVDAAWDNPPVTSEQVLHLGKWETHEAAIELAPMAPPGPGWSRVDDDSYGELGTRIAFEGWLDKESARRVASGWGGDRGALMMNGDTIAFGWRVRYDAVPEGGARRAYEALATAFERRFGMARSREGSFVCFDRPTLGPLALRRRGDDLLVVAGPTKMATPSWSTAGNCAVAKGWTNAASP
jgi:hypothetical protein